MLFILLFLPLNLLIHLLHHCPERELTLVSVLLVLLAVDNNLQYIYLGIWVVDFLS